MRIFYKMRELLMTQDALTKRLESIEGKLGSYDNDIAVLFEYLKKLMDDKEKRTKQSSRKKIGFNKKK